MAGLGEDSSPPAQDSMDSSYPDIKLVLGRQGERGREVTVSREALAGLSPVFKNMLTHDMVEKNQGTVRLEAVSLEAWTVISAFYFSHEKLVTMNNIQEVVSVVDMYELTELKSHCDDLLCENADAFEDFSELLNWATTFRLKKLKTNLLKLAREDFVHFIETNSFLRLSKEALLEILGGSYIVSSEDTVCCAVLRWLQDQNADHDTAEQLLTKLKLYEVCLSCLEWHVRRSQYAAFRDIVLCLIEKEKQVNQKHSVQWFAHKKFGRVYIQPPDKSGWPFGPTCGCKPSEKDDRVCFGYQALQENHGVILDGSLTKQVAVPHLWTNDHCCTKFFFAACFFEKFLVVHALDMHVTNFFDLDARRWAGSFFLRQARQRDGLVSVGDAVYVVMGECKEMLASIEVFTSHAREWRLAGHMQIATTSVAAAAVGNLIIASGSSIEEKIYQSFNTETGAAVILHRGQYSLHQQRACSLGFRGALFGQKGSFICIRLQENGEVAVTEERYPNTSAAFHEAKFRGPDIQSRAEGGDSLPQKLQQLVQRNPENTVYSIQFSPGDKRANIVPLPLSINGLIWFVRFHA